MDIKGQLMSLKWKCISSHHHQLTTQVFKSISNPIQNQAKAHQIQTKTIVKRFSKMEFTTVASVLLAATAAIAAPTTANAKRAQSLQIKNFSVRLASTVNMGMLELVLYDPNSPTVNGTNPTGCNANW